MPASGSVTPNAMCRSPTAARGRNVSFSRSLPNFTTGFRPNIVRCSARRPVHRRTRRGDPVEHDRTLGDAASATAVLLRDGDTEPAALGHRRVEGPRELVALISLGPVRVVEVRAHPIDRVGDRNVVVVEREVHAAQSRGHRSPGTSCGVVGGQRRPARPAERHGDNRSSSHDGPTTSASTARTRRASSRSAVTTTAPRWRPARTAIVSSPSPACAPPRRRP